MKRGNIIFIHYVLEEGVWFGVSNKFLSSSPVPVPFSHLARPFDMKIQFICRNVTYVLKHQKSFVSVENFFFYPF